MGFPALSQPNERGTAMLPLGSVVHNKLQVFFMTITSAMIGDSTSSNGSYTTFNSAVRNGGASNGAARKSSTENNNGGLTTLRPNGAAAAAATTAATLSSPILDAKEKHPLEREDFLQAYRDKVKEFNDEKGNGVLFYTNIEDPNSVQEFCPRGVVLERNRDQGSSDDSSRWDAWIRKVPNKGHQAATNELGRQLSNYAVAMSSKFNPEIQGGGGHEAAEEVVLADNEVLPEKRIDPDEVIRVVVDDDNAARVVVEVELSNRDPLQLSKHVQQLMKSWPHLRCVVALKIYKRACAGEKFSCVCFVWKKDKSDNSIYVERVFDVGPKPTKMRSVQDIAEFWSKEGVGFGNVSQDNGQSFRITPMPAGLNYPLPRECPDDLEDHFTVTVDKSDVYHGHTPKKWQRKKKPKRTEDVKDDESLELNLFPVIRAVDKFKETNFN